MLESTLSSFSNLYRPLLAEGTSPLGRYSDFIMFGLMFVVIWLVMLRPASREEKLRKQRLGGLKRGDQIVLRSGLLGQIANIDNQDDRIVVVELADRVKVLVLRAEIQDLRENVLKPKTTSASTPAASAQAAPNPSEATT